ncbi:MAG: phosphoribosylaminoimidazolesuccinocarboxamide synthase [Candidatus Micrarchaeota archaeon]
MQGRFLHAGKVKNVFQVGENELEFEFSNRVSVFDKIIPSEIPFKGETLCRTSAYWFKICEGKGINTHFLSVSAPNKMRVKKVDIISDYSKISTNTRNYLIPLEVIVRYYAYGSLMDRIQQGKVKPEQLGFPAGHKVENGEELPEPFFEATTKLEKTDRPISNDEAMKISGMTLEEFRELKETSLKIDEEIASRVRQRGLIHVDGKKEFAFDAERTLTIVDTFGTADEDRWWNAKEFKEGKYVEKSKEFVRQYYREIGYHELLYKAREEGMPEPDIPPLPHDKVEETSGIYVRLFEQLTGESFR